MEHFFFDNFLSSFCFQYSAEYWLLLEKINVGKTEILECYWWWLEKLNTPYFILAVFVYLAPGS